MNQRAVVSICVFTRHHPRWYRVTHAWHFRTSFVELACVVRKLSAMSKTKTQSRTVSTTHAVVPTPTPCEEPARTVNDWAQADSGSRHTTPNLTCSNAMR